MLVFTVLTFLAYAALVAAQHAGESFLRPGIRIASHNASVARLSQFGLLNRRQSLGGCDPGEVECGDLCIASDGYDCCDDVTGAYCDISTSECAANNEDCTCTGSATPCGTDFCLPDGYTCCGVSGDEAASCEPGTYCDTGGCCETGQVCNGIIANCIDFSDSACGGATGESVNCCPQEFPYCTGTSCSNEPVSSGGGGGGGGGSTQTSSRLLSSAASTGFLFGSSTRPASASSSASTFRSHSSPASGAASVVLTSGDASGVSSASTSSVSITGSISSITNPATRSTVGVTPTDDNSAPVTVTVNPTVATVTAPNSADNVEAPLALVVAGFVAGLLNI